MAGTDVFNLMAFDPTTWSDSVTYTPAGDGTPERVTIDALGSTDVTLDGTAEASGDTLSVGDAGGLASGWTATFDIPGGIVLQDTTGAYNAFLSQPMVVGATYDAVSGFGHFSDSGNSLACFVAGTRIATPRGEVPIDDLRPGDLVLTATGRVPTEIIWVGRRRVRCDRHPRPTEVQPVRVEAGALAPGVPARHLFLSPDHALSIDGALVPARCLVNGASIRRVAFAAVTYHHLELARHGTVLAEGAAAETYLDTGNRSAFDQAKVVALHAWLRPQAAVPMDGYALLTHGPKLEEVRRALLHRAHALGYTLTADPALELFADDRPIPLAVTGPTYRATIPAGTRRLSLGTRTARPAETAAASTDDRRLGLCVVALRVAGSPIQLEHPMLEAGWHASEGGLRWTGGAAHIALAASDRPQELQVMTAGELRYWVEPNAAPASRALARARAIA